MKEGAEPAEGNQPPYAHTGGESKKDWEPLFSHGSDCEGRDCDKCADLDEKHGHLNKVAHLAREFARDLFEPGSEAAESASDWGFLAGLWHDLGKFAPDWQAYLAAKAGIDPHQADAMGKVDHSTAGAQHAVDTHPIIGHLLAFIIAGHHSGLLNAHGEGATLQKRLSKTDIARWKESTADRFA